jgi:glycosyltransferase involved in cell wall biosynthesis
MALTAAGSCGIVPRLVLVQPALWEPGVVPERALSMKRTSQMSDKPYLSLILPAYNEVRSIGATLRGMQDYLDAQPYRYEIIVAADGDDGTRELIAEKARTDARLSVLGSVERSGKGRGIRLGVQRARGQVIGFADADNKTPIDEVAKLLPWLVCGYDIVIGSRGVADAQIEVAQPWFRRLGSRAFALAMHLTLGLWHIHDTQCGFKFFRGDVARDLFARQRIDGYMFDVEVLHLAQRSCYRIKEVGVRWRDDGDSRLRLVAGNWRNMIDILRIRFGRSRPAEKPAPQAVASENPPRWRSVA